LIKHPINRYLINAPMLSSMKKNADGSLTLYIQKDSPGSGKEANWLPAPDGTIYLVMRLYWPKDTPPGSTGPSFSSNELGAAQQFCALLGQGHQHLKRQIVVVSRICCIVQLHETQMGLGIEEHIRHKAGHAALMADRHKIAAA
jgi:Protein of unknown function (DUF1214)